MNYPLSQSDVQSISQIAKRQGPTSYEELALRFKVHVSRIIKIDIDYNKKWWISHDRMGRPELRPYIVATRPAIGAWPLDPAIIEARLKHDAGLVDMCQARDGDRIILYAIPRKNFEEKRRKYFHGETIG